jgi:hypothetical protein
MKKLGRFFAPSATLELSASRWSFVMHAHAQPPADDMATYHTSDLTVF